MAVWGAYYAPSTGIAGGSRKLEFARLRDAGARRLSREQHAITAQDIDDPLDPLALIAFLTTGAIAGTLAGLLGVGGGAIIVPALIGIFGYLQLEGPWHPHQAVATSLVTIIATGAVSAFTHHRRGAVDWPLFRILGVGLLFGALGGALLGGQIAPLWLQRLFALFLLYTGIRMLLKPRVIRGRSLPGPAGLAGAGVGIGSLSAMLGVGGGILVVPFLARRGIAMHTAVGTASACGIAIATTGSLGFVAAGWNRPDLPSYSLGFIYWPAALAIVAASMPTANLGARLAHRLPTATLKRIFAVLLILVAGGLLIG